MIRRVTIITHSIGVGGIGKVVVTIANYWAAMGRNVSILLVLDHKEDPFLPLHPNVELFWIPATTILRNTFSRLLGYGPLIRKLRSRIKETSPDIIISLMDWINILSLLATVGLHIPIIVSERGDPTRETLHPWWKTLRHWLYPRANALVAVSQGVLAHFHPRRDQIFAVIPGSATPPDEHRLIRPRVKRQDEPFVLISLGRLVPEKGFDILIEAFASLTADFPNWELHLWGEGPEKYRLDELIIERGLFNKVLLRGETKQPYDVLLNADVFAFSSRSGSDGHPNVLVEALMCGLPVVSFDCREGPREIIDDNVNGILVEDGNSEEFIASLRSLMVSESERIRLTPSIAHIVNRFGPKVTMAKWEEVLQACLQSDT